MVAVLHNRVFPLITFFLGSFLLHLLWENAQAPLFEGYVSFGQHFPICLRGTLTGDMLFTLVIYLTLALVHRDWWCLSNPQTYRHPATWLLPVTIGLLLATSFEFWAMYVAQRWTYTPAMPIVPILGIGLTPLLQMVLLPLLTLLLTKKFLTLP